MPKKYAYAVMDGNEAPDQTRFACSCHDSLERAQKAAERLNKGDYNANYYVAHWNASRWAKMRPSPNQFEDRVELP